MIRTLIFVLCLTIYVPEISAQTESTRVYSQEHPLVFEDSWNLWPYAYLNDNGEPEGYCIDLIKIIMRELDIPYIIQLKPHQEALKDLKAGRADLVLGLSDVYGVKFGRSGKSCVALLTQSAVTPKGKPVTIKAFSDLKSQQVIVKDSGLCHQLMVDYEWGSNAIASSDIRKDILEVDKNGKGQIVWNTLSLEWLMNHHHLDHVTLTPVNMPYGERKFMSNDQHLLDLVDKTYINLCAADKLLPLEEKWFYPERQEVKSHTWVWYLAGFALLLLIVAVLFLVRELRQNRKTSKAYHQLVKLLAHEADFNHLRFWIYQVGEQKFEWHDENGEAIKSYTTEEFAKRYNKEDFTRLQEALERIIGRHVDDRGHEETEETLELRALDTEFGDHELHRFVVHLSILNHDAQGNPSFIIGTKKDVTRERQLKQINAERSLRFLSMFYNNESGIFYFNEDGVIQDGNPKAGELLQINIDEVVKKQASLNSIFQTSFSHLADTDGKEGTLTIGNNTVDYRMKAVYDDHHHLIGVFVFCI